MRNVSLVTGTGRCGTTFLMKLFTCLKIDTGINEDQIKNNIYFNCNSGIELNLDKRSAYIYKSPEFCRKLKEIVKKNIKIDFLIVPIRDYEKAANSRVKHGRKNGGLCWGAKDSKSQINEYYKSISILLMDIVNLDINTIFLDYEKMISDKDYLYQKLLPLLSKFQITYDVFCEAYDNDKVKNIAQT